MGFLLISHARVGVLRRGDSRPAATQRQFTGTTTAGSTTSATRHRRYRPGCRGHRPDDGFPRPRRLNSGRRNCGTHRGRYRYSIPSDYPSLIATRHGLDRRNFLLLVPVALAHHRLHRSTASRERNRATPRRIALDPARLPRLSVHRVPHPQQSAH